MKLSKIIRPDAIVSELESVEKREAIGELVHILVTTGRIPKAQKSAVLKALMKREELGSTGIGKGIAVPHTRHTAVEETVGALGRSSKGVAFGSVDGQPVHLVFLLISPPNLADEHVRALTRISLLVKDDDMCRFLRHAKNAKEIEQLLIEADERLGEGEA